jgi:hypothetical protein
MRIECTAEGFEHNWLEIDDSKWSRRVTEKVQAVQDGEPFCELLRQLTKACYLELTNGQTVETAEGITVEAFLDMHETLCSWLGYLMPVAYIRFRRLGEASGQVLFNDSAKKA